MEERAHKSHNNMKGSKMRFINQVSKMIGQEGGNDLSQSPVSRRGEPRASSTDKTHVSGSDKRLK